MSTTDQNSSMADDLFPGSSRTRKEIEERVNALFAPQPKRYEILFERLKREEPPRTSEDTDKKLLIPLDHSQSLLEETRPATETREGTLVLAPATYIITSIDIDLEPLSEKLLSSPNVIAVRFIKPGRYGIVFLGTFTDHEALALLKQLLD